MILSFQYLKNFSRRGKNASEGATHFLLIMIKISVKQFDQEQ